MRDTPELFVDLRPCRQSRRTPWNQRLQIAAVITMLGFATILVLHDATPETRAMIAGEGMLYTDMAGCGDMASVPYRSLVTEAFKGAYTHDIACGETAGAPGLTRL